MTPDAADSSQDAQKREQERETRRRIAMALSRKVTLAAPSAIKDYLGAKFDRLTVCAFSHSIRGKRAWKHFWVVRCSCGEYELRSNKSLGEQMRGAEMCAHCFFAEPERLARATNPESKTLKSIPPPPMPKKPRGGTKAAGSFGANWPPRIGNKIGDST